MTDGKCPLNRVYDDLTEPFEICENLPNDNNQAVRRNQRERAEQAKKKWSACW